MKALPLEGQSVRLRQFRVDDLPSFQAYRADPELGRYQGWRPMSDAAATSFLTEMAAAPFCTPGCWCQLAVANPGTDALIGDIGLHLAADSQTLEIGFTLARAEQGRSLAFEAVSLALAVAFEHLPVQRVQAITDTRNTASVRLLQRLGFAHLATLEALFRGEVCQEHHFEFWRPGGAQSVAAGVVERSAERSALP